MALRLGSILSSKVFFGATEISKIFAGNTLIYENIDSDASAFITAASITNATQITAIDTLVKGLKTNGIWNKMKAIYPFVGGTANSHKFNLKDPRDLDAAFRLQFFGGITHSANGVLPNGTNGYADTFVKISNMVNADLHFSFYSTSNTTAPQSFTSEMGTGFGSGLAYYELNVRRSNGNASTIMSDGLPSISAVNINSQGFFMSSRTSSSVLKLYKNNTILVSDFNVRTFNNIPANNITLYGLKDGASPVGNFSNRNSAFATIGDGLTDTDATNLYNIVQAYQTTLNRQV